MTRVLVSAVPRAILVASSFLLIATPSFSQGRGGPEWSTAGGDAHRTSWIKTDPKISAGALQKPGFQFMWKLKLQNNPLLKPVLLERYIGYRGFRTYAFISDTANNVLTFDSDLARIEWQKKLPGPPASGSATCPGGMTASPAQRVASAFATAPAGRGGGGGRGGPAKSGVGMPGEGAVTIPAVVAAPAAVAPAPAAFPGGGRGRTPSFLTTLSSDGALHDMYVSNGDEPGVPTKFLGPQANATELTVVDNVAYAVTSGNCGDVPDGIWALDLASKNIATWKARSAGTAFGPDSTVYTATSAGELAALTAKTLSQKAIYTAGEPFTTWPVVFEQNGKTLVAAATRSGSIHVVDGASLSKVAASPAGDAGSPVLAMWQDSAGTPWLLHGKTAWKLNNGEFQSGWSAANLGSPASVAVVNGVVFLAVAGNASTHATLYALDAASGKQLWSSGNTITSYIAPGGGLAAGGSAIYLGTHDGTFWAFGFPIEH